MLSGIVITFLLASALMVGTQGIPVSPNQGGTVTGTLKSATGAPAAGVRVSALAKPEELTDLSQSSSLSAIAETDASGRFRLENIPPGRYYVVAGRLDAPTFYPGVVTPDEGVVILVTPGLTVPGIDFALNNVSVGRALSPGSAAPSWVIPIQTRMEDGGKVPMFASGWFPVLRLSRTGSARIERPLVSASVTVPNTEYRATIANLPEGYSVKSFTFGPTDLTIDPLQLAPLVPIAPRAASVPVGQAISIVLQRAPMAARPGARVSGRFVGDTNRSVYISGVPGTLYPDGAFEFFGIPPGRHTVVTLDNPGMERALGASIVVGEADYSNLELEVTSVVPLATGGPVTPKPAGNLTPNTRLPLATIRGRVVDGGTGQALDAGKVVVNKDQSMAISLGAEGRFEVPRLLPGNYVLEIVAYAVGVVSQSVVLDTADADLEVRISPEP